MEQPFYGFRGLPPEEWSDLTWFINNKELALEELRFPEYVRKFLDNYLYHIVIRQDVISITAFDEVNKKFKPFMTLRREGDRIEFNPITNEDHALVYAIAIKAKYLVMPKVWYRTGQWKTEGNTRFCIVEHPLFGNERIKICQRNRPPFYLEPYMLKPLLSYYLTAKRRLTPSEKERRAKFPAVKKSENNPFRS